MIIRLIVNAADLNPFGWISRTVRRLSDPFVMSARGLLMGLSVDPKFAPLIVILISILLGWFFLWLTEEVASTLLGILVSLQAAIPISAVGFIIYGALSVYIGLIFMRIVFSWGMVGYKNRIMR